GIEDDPHPVVAEQRVAIAEPRPDLRRIVVIAPERDVHVDVVIGDEHLGADRRIDVLSRLHFVAEREHQRVLPERFRDRAVQREGFSGAGNRKRRSRPFAGRRLLYLGRDGRACEDGSQQESEDSRHELSALITRSLRLRVRYLPRRRYTRPLKLRSSISGPPPLSDARTARSTSRRNLPSPCRAPRGVGREGVAGMSKSVNVSPLSVRSLRLALIAAGSVTSTSPLSVVNAIGAWASARVRTASTSPLTVWATTEPATLARERSPFMLLASRTP